jgi:RNA polymerase sigma-70 factor (ECF subfamily)
VLRIARNHCLDVLRRRLPEPQRLELDANPDDGSRRELSDPSAPPADDALERRELAGSLERAVAALPPNHREVVHLFHVEHLTYKEIAATLDVPLGTVMTWLHRARARLRDALQASGTESAP